MRDGFSLHGGARECGEVLFDRPFILPTWKQSLLSNPKRSSMDFGH